MNPKEPEVGKTIRATMVPKIRSINEQKRTIEFVASSEAVDRYGDIIRANGWVTNNYQKNPVFLWGHRSSDPPIGKTISLSIQKDPPALIQVVEFAKKETYPFADTIFNLYRDGFMSAVSVGFRPLEKPKMIVDEKDNFTGYEFTKQELLELSAVPIPANPEALARHFAEAEESGDLKFEREIRCALFGEVTVPDKEKSTSLDQVIDSVVATPKKGDAAETVAKVEEVRSLVSRLSDEVRTIGDSSAGREEVSLLESRMQDALSRLDKLAQAVAKDAVVTEALSRIDQIRAAVDKAAQASAKDSALSDAMGRLEEVRSRVDKLLLNSAKRSDLTDLGAKLDALRSALESVAKEATAEHLADSLSELRELVSKFSSEVATKSDINGLVERIENGCKRLDGIEAMIRQGFASVQRDAAAVELVADRSVCPYTDDPIAPKGTKWDAPAEMAKQSKPAGWKHMSTVIVGDAANKTSYKLPHHEGKGFKVVPDGVRAALGRLEATQMPAADRAGARAHLTKHQQKIAEETGFHFDADDFNSKLDALGRSYRAAIEDGDMDAAKALDRLIQRHVDSIFSGMEEPKPAEPEAPKAIESLGELAAVLGKDDGSDDNPDDGDDENMDGCPDCQHDVPHNSGPAMNQCTDPDGCDCQSGYMPKKSE